MVKIKKITSIEILDSRGIPTLKTKIESSNGNVSEASVPSGSSAGKSEAWELRDGGDRYNGKGVRKAVANVNKKIAPKLIGLNPEDQGKVDKIMQRLDGTPNKKSLGANAILSVSLAISKLAAQEKKIPLYKYLNESFFKNAKMNLPTPFSVVIEAGEHSKSNLEVQEFMIVPEGFFSFSEKIEVVAKIFHELADVLARRGYSTNVGLEGAYGPELKSNFEAMDLIVETIKKVGFENKVTLALDVAASEFYSPEAGGVYNLKSAGVALSAGQLFGLYQEWIDKYPLISIEDGLDEEAWLEWSEMVNRFGDKTKIIGDDISVTNPKRVRKGIQEKAFTGCIVKPNQIGTISETIEVINILRDNNLECIISHRGGDTDDTFIADLAVASGAKYIKTGAPSRGERVAKYNRLLEIEEELKD